MNTAVQSLNRFLDGEGFSLAEEGTKTYLLDCDGDRVCTISDDFVAAIAETAALANAVTAPNVTIVLRELYLAHTRKKDDWFKRGERFGRAAVVASAHELLGINRIVSAIEEIATLAAGR